MTEDLGRKHPSSADIQVAELQQWRRFLGETLRRIEDKVDATANDVHEVKTQLRLGGQRMDQIDVHLKATDSRVDKMEDGSDSLLRESAKRDPVTLWTSISAAATAAGAIIYAIIHGSPPGSP